MGTQGELVEKKMAGKLTRDERLRVVNDAAHDAISQFAKGPLVLIALRDANGKPLDHASGTLIRSQNGCVVLTCAHVFENLGNRLTLGHTSGSLVDNALGPAVFHPRRVDVAIAPVLDPGPLVDFSVSLDQIGNAESFPLPPNDPLLVAGFAEHLSHDVCLVRDERDRSGVTRRGYAHVVHLTSLAGQDRRALSIHWDKAEISEQTAATHPLGVVAGVKDLRKPSGLSGGAVWWFGSFATNESLWTAQRTGRLVAVPYQYSSRRQHAVPACVWRSWLKEQLACN